jgi:hypothetical protein
MKLNLRTVRPAVPFAAAALLCAGSAFAGPDKMISAGKLAKDAKMFYGQTVTVKAEVEDVFDDHTISLDEDALLAGGDVLVILPEGKALGVKKDDDVLVTGVVRPYLVADLERDFDFFKDGKFIKTEKRVEYETRPVLVAHTIRSADGRELFLSRSPFAMTTTTTTRTTTHDHGTMGTTTATTSTTTTQTTKPAVMKTISASALAKDGKKYYGHTVTVTGEVEDVLDPHSLTLDEDALLAGHDVLVLLPEGKAFDLKKDDKITITGTVRQYVAAELDRDFDFFEEGKIVKVERKTDFESRPVLVATSVRTADGRELLTPPAARVKQ